VATYRSMLIDDVGELRPANNFGLRNQRDNSTLSWEDAVVNLGFIYIRFCGSALLITFRPTTATPLAVASAFYEIAKEAPERVVLVYGRPERFEVLNRQNQAMRRMEALIDAAQNPLPRPPFRAERVALDRLGTIAAGRFLPLYRPRGNGV